MRRQPANTRDGPAGGVDMDDGRVKIDKSILIHEIRLMWIMIDDADLQQGSLGDGWSQARKEIFFHLLEDPSDLPRKSHLRQEEDPRQIPLLSF